MVSLPSTFKARADNFLNLTAEFSKDFELAATPSKSKLYIKAFKKYHLWVNDKEFLSNSATETNWKKLWTQPVRPDC